MTDPTADLLGLLAFGVPVGDGRTPPEALDSKGLPKAALAILYGGTPNPLERRLTFERGGLGYAWRLVVVNNNPAGTRLLADRAVHLIDGARLPTGEWLQVGAVSDPLEDRDDPSAYRWSSTVEITTALPR